MATDLQVKVEKYESKAAQCKEWAEKAAEGPQRALYEVLAGYYGGLATDFRQINEKRKSVQDQPASAGAESAVSA